MKKIIFYKLVIISLLIFSACECPLEVDNTVIPMNNVRDASIHEFVPDSGDNNVVHGLVFPFSQAVDAELKKDSRFAEGQVYTLFEPFPFQVDNETYRAVILDKYPLNKDMINDIIITSVSDPRGSNSSNPPTATMRVKGEISKYYKTFDNTSSAKFREFLDEADRLNEFIEQLSLYGRELDAIVSEVNYTMDDVVILNSDDEIVTNIAEVPQNILNQIEAELESDKYISYDLTISEGDVFIYRAQNGKDFLMVVKEIRQDRLANKRIVDIMFDELR